MSDTGRGSGVEDLLGQFLGVVREPDVDAREPGPNPIEDARRKVTVRVFRALGLTGMPATDPHLSIERQQDGSVVIEWDRFAKNWEGRKIIDRPTGEALRERVRSTLTVSHKVVG